MEPDKKVNLLKLVLCLLLIPTGHDCHQWTSHLSSGIVKYACVGSTAVLPWAVSLDNTEQIHDIQWMFNGPSGPQIVAYYANGNFMSGPAYGHRVSFVPSAGIMLSNVTENDTGNYTVEVTGRKTGESGMWSLWQHGFLHVLGDTVVSSGGLQVKQETVAVHNNVTGQWQVDLTCGDFPFANQPPFDVEWTSPSGGSLPTYYRNGKFHLLLTQSQAAGRYTCTLPDKGVCSQGSTLSGPGPSASVLVDEDKANLALLEARFQNGDTVASHVSNLAQQNQLLQQEKTSLTQQGVVVLDVNKQLKQRHSLLNQEKAQLLQKLDTLENKFEQLSQQAYLTENVTEGCFTLNRTVTVLDIYLNQTTIHLQQDIDKKNRLLNQASQKCADARKQFEEQYIQFIVANYAKNVSSLSHELHALANGTANTQGASGSGSSTGVSFHARRTQFDGLSHANHVVMMKEVSHNEGDGYNGDRGVFIAPQEGTYFLMASAAPLRDIEDINFDIRAGKQSLHSIVTGGPHDRVATAQGIVYLNQGAHVWMKSSQLWYPAATEMSGFLIE